MSYFWEDFVFFALWIAAAVLLGLGVVCLALGVDSSSWVIDGKTGCATITYDHNSVFGKDYTEVNTFCNK